MPLVLHRGIEPQASFSVCFLMVSEGEGGRETIFHVFYRGIEPQASFSTCFLVVFEREGGGGPISSCFIELSSLRHLFSRIF